MRYALAGFLDELRTQIARVRQENLEVHWESYVYEVFSRRPNTGASGRLPSACRVTARSPLNRPQT